MNNVLILILSIIALPVIYLGGIWISKSSVTKEEIIGRKPLHSVLEIIVVSIAEILTIKLWYSFIYICTSKIYFAMLFVALALVTIICITDIWDNLVSNKILLISLCIFVLIIGMFFLTDMNIVTQYLIDSVIGLVFCFLCFGIVYIATRGGLGAGDVKLALILGIIMTDKYVVKTLLFACIVSAIYSLVMMIRKKLNRHSTFPFIPFVFIGMAITIILS